MKDSKVKNIVSVILKAVAVGAGIAVVVLSCLKTLDTNTGITLLGIGLSCAAIAMLEKKE